MAGIQKVHIFIGHVIAEIAEEALYIEYNQEDTS